MPVSCPLINNHEDNNMQCVNYFNSSANLFWKSVLLLFLLFYLFTKIIIYRDENQSPCDTRLLDDAFFQGHLLLLAFIFCSFSPRSALSTCMLHRTPLWRLCSLDLQGKGICLKPTNNFFVLFRFLGFHIVVEAYVFQIPPLQEKWTLLCLFIHQIVYAPFMLLHHRNVR